MNYIIRRKNEGVYEFVIVTEHDGEHLLHTGDFNQCLHRFRVMGVAHSELQLID